MKIDTLEHSAGQWRYLKQGIEDKSGAQLVCVFGDTDEFKQPQHYHAIRELYPTAHIIGCSSSGHVIGDEMSKAPIVASAISLEHGSVSLAYMDFEPGDDVEQLSQQLLSELDSSGMKHIFILSDGLYMNGSALVRGINRVSPVPVSGGMAGDGARFQETWVIADDEPKQKRVVAVGFYGEGLTISSGSFAGWSEFGADRLVTRSEGNVLYELDNQPALDLYKTYLGDYAQDLPNSGLRFPLSIRAQEDDPEIIRTLLAIDEEARSITFAGDIPEGYTARLMKPDNDVLIDGAGKAAEMIERANDKTALALVVSCLGRKVVMNQLVDEELEEVQSILGDNVQLSGYYSYGEIAPSKRNELSCDLHNQTMTLTVVYEE